MNDISSTSLPQNDMLLSYPLGPRSQLVSDFFDHMNRCGISWVVMNNYEGLPWVIPSDIDFSIPPDLFYKLDFFINDFSRSAGARIVQKLWHGNMKCAYILAVGPEGAREFVQLDFFTAFSTKGCPELIRHEDMVAGRTALRNFHVPRPEVELVFTAMRRLFKNDWSVRHCARIAELHRRIADAHWLPSRYGWMRPTLEAAMLMEVETVTERRAQDWAQLRVTASGSLSLPKRIANAAIQARRIAARLRDETGQLIVLIAPRDSIETGALETLELVFHRRMFLQGKVTVTLLAKLALLKRRKGLIFVLAGADQPEGRVLARQLGRMGLVDQVLYRADSLHAGVPGVPGLAVATTPFASNAEMIGAIVTAQAAKTAKAIDRGGTQTSDGIA